VSDSPRPDRPAALARIGIIGDVHAEHRRLEVVLDHLRASALDATLCVGDVVNGNGDPNRCAALLEQASVITVRGNHDRWVLSGELHIVDGVHRLSDLEPATVAFLERLPSSVELTAVDGTAMLLCHGLGDNDMNTTTADDYGYALEANDDLQALLGEGLRRIVVKGHRHRAAVWNVGALTLVDAGSLVPYTGQEVCGYIIDLAGGMATPLRLDSGRVVRGETIPCRPAAAAQQGSPNQ
jgi:predicted phosphodiesterase